MKWEVINQEMEMSHSLFGGHFNVQMWRAWVPGGWFVCTRKPESDTMMFYPDPDHIWTLNEDYSDKSTLLRPLDSPASE